LAKLPSYVREVNTAFECLLEEYCRQRDDIAESIAQITHSETPFNVEDEEKLVASFLETPCPCSHNCQQHLTYDEVMKNRAFFRSLEKHQRNLILLVQLQSLASHSAYSTSARSKKRRTRKRFEYRISSDRPVCKAVFLFYYGETSKRLERLQSYVSGEGLTLPIHGNSGRRPSNAYPPDEKANVKAFIANFTTIHGLPDPGRDVRKGKGKLRILLPSLMTYNSVHAHYARSSEASGRPAIAYRTFLKIWQEAFPYITFNDPRSDLCMTCEDLKKRLNQVSATLDDTSDTQQGQIHTEALEHLDHVKQERLFYQANAKVAHEYYRKMGAQAIDAQPSTPNSRHMMSHYSWDFAQQLHYPFEDQQVGPIFFKTPRRAQLFGICNEGIPRQYNYLIDEADFLGKNANTVISLLDHFFTNYGLGEKWVHLTADNCVGQNKNNAVLQYLMYRVLTGLHDKIELSFLLVGHTKFSPDGFFGLIKQHYRRSQVYTYDQLANIVESSSKNGHNRCIRVSKNLVPPVLYRDWSTWLSQYFSACKGLSAYQHFRMEKHHPSMLFVKERKNSQEAAIKLAKDGCPLSNTLPPETLPEQILPAGLSAKRQWYLYNQIRCHIPNDHDKNETCPLPQISQTERDD
jgi:hypothetical protein